MARISKPLIYGGLGLIVVTAVIMTSSDPGSDQGVQTRRAERGSGAGSQAQDQFFASDYEAEFERLNESPRNAFNPLIIREGPGSGGGLMPNELPSSFTDGEPGWMYTGTVESNGVPSALLENKVTGKGMFLKVGEKLKRTTITKIAPTYIILEGYTGRTVTLDLLADLPDPDDEFYGLGIEPMNPNVGSGLSGPIRSMGATEDTVSETSEIS